MPRHAAQINIRPLQRGIAALAAVLYLLFATGVLPALALQSQHHTTSHGKTECSGDCERDGCALENQLKRSCCCWQKKQRLGPAAEPSGTAGDCCHAAAAPDRMLAVVEDSLAAQQGQNPASAAALPASAPVFTCSCPCDGANQSVLFISQVNEILPFVFRTEFIPPDDPPFPKAAHLKPGSLSSEPPVPPPEPA